MGTRADFYIKKAEEKELIWIASIAWDGYPDGIDDENDFDLLKSTTQVEYIARLQRFLSKRDDVTLPENGWPWPWDNSNTTDYAYCFHDGKVYANCFGNGWYDPIARMNRDAVVINDDAEDEPEIIWEHEYPDMSKIKNVRYDKGSGLIVISLLK